MPLIIKAPFSSSNYRYSDLEINNHHQRRNKGDSETPQNIIRSLTLTCLFFLGVLTIIATAFVLRYEGKVNDYGKRIADLEEKLLEKLDHWNWRNNETRNIASEAEETLRNDDGSVFFISLPKSTRNRSKRQTQTTLFPSVPNAYLGPNLQRTDDEVPILDQSYNKQQPLSFTRQQQPVQTISATTDSEGLRLYEGLVETGGRNEPKSPDFYPNPDSSNPTGILPHHRVSAAWSEKAVDPKLSMRRLQLRSGDNYEGSGPRFAQEMSYVRSTDRDRMYNVQGSSSRSGGNTVRRRIIRPSSRTRVSGGGGVYHRDHRVAETHHAYQRRRWKGDEGEIIARVVQPEDSYPTRKLMYSETRPMEYNNGNRRRFSPPSPENPAAGYSYGRGPLNVTIERSVPFGTYYYQQRGNQYQRRY